MKAVVLYGSSRGNTQTVVQRLSALLKTELEVCNVAEVEQARQLMADAELLLLFASTWGDGELQLDMENFLATSPMDLQGKPYALCELGNYYGYDDFEFGAAVIMKHFLDAWGGRELIEPFSMDSLPFKDWSGLERWCGLLNTAIARQSETGNA